MFVGPPLISGCLSFLCGTFVDCPNPLCVCLNWELASFLFFALRAWAGFEIPSRSSLSQFQKHRAGVHYHTNLV